MKFDRHPDPIVITGIGLVTSIGLDRETTWRAVRSGQSRMRFLSGMLGIPDGTLIGAVVDGVPTPRRGELKPISLARLAAREALADADLDRAAVPDERIACALAAHMGDTGMIEELSGMRTPLAPDEVPHHEQWLPATGVATIAGELRLFGPRICHSVACASGLIEVLSAASAIRDGQCDVAVAGSAEAIHPLFAAGFHAMRVLAHDERPERACRPFDARRKGFVMGEGAAMFVLERQSDARARGAKWYAEIVAAKEAAEAYHLTGLDTDSRSLVYAIRTALARAELAPGDIGYINAHGTGTQQNDLAETRGIHMALGPAVNDLCVSANKSMLGHLVNAAGSVELALTALALRDSFAPPTLNLTEPDPACDLDYIPLVGRRHRCEHALKLSVAFGGHLVAVVLRRGNRVSELPAVRPAARRAA